MMALLAIFSHQVRDLRTINEIKNIRSASERILSYIKTNINENQEFKLNLSLKDIAHKIGLAHETFYRELKNLENLGKIKRYSDRIKLI
jgi:DNA-binding Lrp family transcriptional regulator